MRVVITGANGFIGKHTIRAFLKAGYQVLGLDVAINLLEEFKDNPNFSAAVADITSPTFKDFIQYGDKVLHLAAIAKFEDCEANPQRAVLVNVLGTLNVVKACIEKHAERLIYSSTGAVYSTSARTPIREDEPRIPASIYGWSKKQSEDWIIHFGEQLPYVILRYGYIYGKEKDWGAVGKFLTLISKGEKPVLYGGEQINDFTHVDDIVQANLLALETKHLNQIYNIGTGVPTSIKDVCKICQEILGKDVGIEIKPARPFDLSIFVYDISKAKLILGYNPKWKIRDGIRDIAS